jgi:hypothetical protein
VHEDNPRWEEINPSSLAHEKDGLRLLASYLLALDLLERYGRDILDIVDFLDGQGGVASRPETGQRCRPPRPKDRHLHLCVFDFSMAATAATQLGAGTRCMRRSGSGLPPKTVVRHIRRQDFTCTDYARSVEP